MTLPGMTQRRFPDLLEDVTWLLGFGESPELIERRLGYAKGSIRQSLKRHGVTELAAKFPCQGGRRAA